MKTEMKAKPQTGAEKPNSCEHPLDAVLWNPYNKVVQCHHCGQIMAVEGQHEAPLMGAEKPAAQQSCEYCGYCWDGLGRCPDCGELPKAGQTVEAAKPAAHTPSPSPWTLEESEAFEDSYHFIDADGEPINGAVSVTLTKPNARLIAAAPELLEALYEARLCLSDVCPHDTPVLVNVRAAIAKAEGRAQ